MTAEKVEQARDLPIIFTGTDPAKIRAGTKTQTRRIIKPQPSGTIRRDVFARSGFSDAHGTPVKFRYAVGERRYLKEAWQYFDWSHDGEPYIRYKSDGSVQFFEGIGEDDAGAPLDKWEELSTDENRDIDGKSADRKWRSPLFMPRWASPTVVEIVSVRAEWLQDISEADAVAEGFLSGADLLSALEQFADEWERIHGPGSWALNPVVEAIEFKVVT